jgi:hypothetical protein
MTKSEREGGRWWAEIRALWHGLIYWHQGYSAAVSQEGGPSEVVWIGCYNCEATFYGTKPDWACKDPR